MVLNRSYFRRRRGGGICMGYIIILFNETLGIYKRENFDESGL